MKKFPREVFVAFDDSSGESILMVDREPTAFAELHKMVSVGVYRLAEVATVDGVPSVSAVPIEKHK